ncbi:MAG: hypothetical protein U5R31_08720 [Acidimicrobiia bacterium]|nr:hypothetical protein [Acidimicrobiia bacterium]
MHGGTHRTTAVPGRIDRDGRSGRARRLLRWRQQRLVHLDHPAPRRRQKRSLRGARAARLAGLVDEAAYQARIDRYLSVATAEPSIRATRRASPPSSWPRTATPTTAGTRREVTVDGLADVWERIDTWQDTRDFRLMYLHWVLALADGSSETTTLDPALVEAIEQRMVDNRYRYDDPLPDGRLDNLWFWSENHLIIGLVGEYLAGTRMPDRTFTITGLTGAEHAERSKQPILDWVHERARFGFFEWHSHIYMKKNVEPLLTLVEFADDPELVEAGAMGLDLCVLDMAAHNHNGTYTASRGRTYANTKTAPRESTFDVFKLLFDDTEFSHRDGVGRGRHPLRRMHAATGRRRSLIDMATRSRPRRRARTPRHLGGRRRPGHRRPRGAVRLRLRRSRQPVVLVVPGGGRDVAARRGGAGRGRAVPHLRDRSDGRDRRRRSALNDGDPDHVRAAGRRQPPPS